MIDSKQARLGVAVVVGGILLATATWLTGSEGPPRSENTPRESMESAPRTGADAKLDPVAVDSVFRIVEHGRLSLAVDALPREGPLTLVLDLPDQARGPAPHPIRIVSADGRRIETTAIPLAGTGTGVQLQIDSEFLSHGLYMIEIDTHDPAPLQIRRYVLELK